MYTFKIISSIDGKAKIKQVTDAWVHNSAYPDPYLYFQSNKILWANHKNDDTNEIDFEWIKTEEELKDDE